jgi:hypothetical protein
MTDLQSLA